MTAGNNLSVEAGNDLTVEGTALTAGNDVALTAGENLTVASASNTETRSYSNWGNQYRLNNSETAASISAGDALTATAGNGLAVQASTLEAVGDIALTGTTGVTVEAKAVRSGWRMSDVKDLATTHQSAGITAGGDVTVNATLGNVDVRGSNVKGRDTTLNALGSVTVDKVQNTRETASPDGDYWTETYQLRNKGAKVEATDGLTLNATLGDVTVDASSLKSGGVTTLNAATGKVELLASKDVDYTRTYGTSDNGLFITTLDRGSYDETVKHTTIDAGGGLVINAGNGLTVDYKGGGGVDGAVEALSKQPGLAWMAEIKNRDDVTWNAVQEAHRSWDFKAQSLNPAAAAMISMVVSAVMMNPAFTTTIATTNSAGTLVIQNVAVDIGGKLAASMGFAHNGIMAAALQAGMTSLASTAATSLVANKGDLGDVFKDLGSSDALRSLASSMISAGLLKGVGAQLNIDFNATDLPDRIKTAAFKVAVNSAVQGTVGGQDLSDTLKNNLISAGTQVISGELSEQIGNLHHAGEIPDAVRMLAHAAVGCGSGAVSGNCAGGAAGAVAAEIVSDSYLKNSLVELNAQKDTLTTEEYLRRNQEILQTGLTLAQFSGAIASLAVSGDPAAGASAGLSAAKENSFKLVTTVAKVSAKLAKKVAKNGKLTLDDIRQSGVDELVGLMDDLRTLADGELNEDDAFALISLAIGVDKNDFEYVKKLADFNKSLPNELSKIDEFVDLTDGRATHILTNHKFGAGKLNKTEFPETWSDGRIIHQVSDIITDPTLTRSIDQRGTPYIEGVRDGVEIRVTFFADGHPNAGKIASAYPLNAPRNPRK